MTDRDILLALIDKHDADARNGLCDDIGPKARAALPREDATGAAIVGLRAFLDTPPEVQQDVLALRPDLKRRLNESTRRSLTTPQGDPNG